MGILQFLSSRVRFLEGNFSLIATPHHSPSTPDLLYPHTHLTSASPANLPINQNGLPVFESVGQPAAQEQKPDELMTDHLDLDVERQHALFYNDLLNSNSLDETLSNVGSADHLIHGGHGNFLSVNHSRTFLQGNLKERLL